MRFVGAAHPLHSDGLAAAAARAGVDPAVLWSVVVVETAGCGFLPDRRPRILFERHIFSARTARRFDAAHPGISGSAGSYGQPGAHQYERLEEAIACDRRAALESASWGLGQVMGFNAPLAGFRDAEDMVSQMMRSENEQILAMASFMRASGMHAALQRRDWAAFARRYNGPAFARNRYHEKLDAAHTGLSGKGLPDLDVRAVQLLLTYHGFNPGKIDGIVGGRTRTAIAAFATKHRFPATGDHKDLRAALLEMLPPAADDQGALPSSAGTTPQAAPDLRLVQLLPIVARISRVEPRAGGREIGTAHPPGHRRVPAVPWRRRGEGGRCRAARRTRGRGAARFRAQSRRRHTLGAAVVGNQGF